jgi:hypothetical protein
VSALDARGRHIRAALVAGIALLILFFSAIELWIYYDRTRPPTPDPAVGRIYPMNTHGSIVYLLYEERVRLYGLIGAALIAGVVMIGIELLKGRFLRRPQAGLRSEALRKRLRHRRRAAGARRLPAWPTRFVSGSAWEPNPWRAAWAYAR